MTEKQAATRVNDNLVRRDGQVHCVHCDTLVGGRGEAILQRALVRRGDIGLAGPQIRPGVPAFITEEVEFRQRLCPGCYTALLTEVVAVADAGTRQVRLAH